MNKPNVMTDKRACRAFVQPFNAFAVNGAQFDFNGDDASLLITHALSPRLLAFEGQPLSPCLSRQLAFSLPPVPYHSYYREILPGMVVRAFCVAHSRQWVACRALEKSH
jgi:hypothetical protein